MALVLNRILHFRISVGKEEEVDDAAYVPA